MWSEEVEEGKRDVGGFLDKINAARERVRKRSRETETLYFEALQRKKFKPAQRSPITTTPSLPSESLSGSDSTR